MAWKVNPSSGTGDGDIVTISNDEENLARASRDCNVVFTNQENDSVTVRITQSGQKLNRSIDTSPVEFSWKQETFERSILSNAKQLKFGISGDVKDRIDKILVTVKEDGSVLPVTEGNLYQVQPFDTGNAKEVIVTVMTTESTASVSGSLMIYDCTDSTEGELVITIPISTDVSGFISVNPLSIVFDAGNDTQTVSVGSGSAWTAEKDASWIFLSRESGDAGLSQQVTVSAGSNTTRTDREADVTFSNGVQDAKLHVLQPGQDIFRYTGLEDIVLGDSAMEADGELATNAASITISADGDSTFSRLRQIRVQVGNNSPKTFASLPCSVDVCGAEDPAEMVFIHFDFASGFDGTGGRLRIDGQFGDMTETEYIQVSEKGMSVTPLMVEVPAAGTAQEVTVRSASGWTAEIESEQVYDMDGNQINVLDE